MTPRLLETMRAEEGAIALLDRHLARLATSARAFGYPFDVAEIRSRVRDALADGGWIQGVRLTLGSGGDSAVDAWPLGGPSFRTAWIDPEPFEEAGGPLCVHKTTARDHYRRRSERAQALGAEEAILVGARGEVIEGTRTSVWAEIDGRLWTPPLSEGGLPGVMRGYLLDTHPLAAERSLTVADLRSAQGVFLSNALRGWMPVALASDGSDGAATG